MMATMIFKISVLKCMTASVLNMICISMRILCWCMSRVVFVTVTLTKKWIWNEQMGDGGDGDGDGGDNGDGGHEGRNKWPTALDRKIFPYLDDNGCLKP